MSKKNILLIAKKYELVLSGQHALYRLINSTYDVNSLVIRLTRLLCQIMNAKEGVVAILDPGKRYAAIKCISLSKRKIIVRKKARFTNPIERKLVKNITCINNDYLIGVPMMAEDIIGIVVLKRAFGQPQFDDHDLEILSTLTAQASMGLKNAQLAEEQQKMIFGSVKAISRLLTNKIPGEYAHTPYFSSLVADIASKLGLREKEIRILKYASMLHDAGKIDIPSAILRKTTRLTQKEFSLIKNHPIASARMLKSLQILRPALPIIIHHHEKYDGTGYPSHLKKGRIPLGARIMAVADAFEAMTFGRPYKGRMNVKDVVNEIKKKGGSQFDPKVVDAFLKVMKTSKINNYLKKSAQNHFFNPPNSPKNNS